MATNILNLPEADQKRISLQRKASLLARNLKIGSKTRNQANDEINSLPDSDRENFKEYLNFYRGVE